MQTNNKLREALEKASIFLHKHHMGAVCMPDGSVLTCWQLAKIVDSALAEPVKNCEVGTAEEQTKRKYEFCQKQRGCCNCPFNKGPDITSCVLAWAQMPYPEGSAK